MADEGPLRNWGLDGERRVRTEMEVKIGKGVMPTANIPTPEVDLAKNPKTINDPPGQSQLDSALQMIGQHIERGHAFTNGQLDIGAKLLMTKLSREEYAWVLEIAQKIHRRPFWHLWVGWFKFCQENSMAQAPTFDSSWNTQVEADPNMSTCAECHRPFTPQHYGQVFCTNKCGAQADQRRVQERIAQQQQPHVEV